MNSASQPAADGREAYREMQNRMLRAENLRAEALAEVERLKAESSAKTVAMIAMRAERDRQATELARLSAVIERRRADASRMHETIATLRHELKFARSKKRVLKLTAAGTPQDTERQ